MPSRSTIGLLAAVTTTACGDSQLSIDFTIPPAYGDAVAIVTLDLHEPPPSAPFDCDALAFGEVDETRQALSRVQQLRLTGDSTASFTGVSRSGSKVLLAQGLDELGLQVVVGCTAIEHIDGDTSVAIAGEPAAIVTRLSDPDTVGSLGVPLPAVVPVRVTDVHLDPLRNVEVRWHVLGPAGSASSGSVETNLIGDADVTPAAPNLPGPAALALRARWQRNRLARITGILDVPAHQIALDAVVVGYVAGRLGADGAIGVAALATSATPSLTAIVTTYWDTGLGEFRDRPPRAVDGATAMAVIQRGGEDHLVAASADTWFDLDAAGNVVQAPLVTPSPGQAPARVLPIGGCEPGAPPELLINFADGSVAAYDQLGAPISHVLALVGAAAEVVDAGCVIDSGGVVRRVAIYGDPEGGHLIVANMDVAAAAGPWATLRQSIGFSPAFDGQPPLLLGMDLANLSAVALGRFLLQPVAGNQLRAELVTADTTLLPPIAMRAGDLDADGRADLAALLSFGSDSGAVAYSRFVVLGAESGGERLSGLYRTTISRPPSLLVVDFDGDGADDVVVGTLSGAAATTQNRIWIYRSGAFGN